MTLKIEIYSDVICPWCYIGKKRLEKALEMVRGEYEALVTWLPFELNPEMPREGHDRKSYLTEKFGGSEKLDEMDARVGEAAQEEKIPMKIGKIRRSPNTLDAHRLIWMAEKEGLQDMVVEALFKAYFCEGRDVGKRSVLLEIAGGAGMKAADEGSIFGEERSRTAVKEEEVIGHRLGIHSVPSFIFNGKYLVTGARYPETLVSAMKKARTGNGKES